MYEVACASGPGYVIATSTPPKSFDCIVLAAQAEQTRAAGNPVAPGALCSLPGNQNTQGVLAGYAHEAGVDCRVDAGKVVGTNAEGNFVYEIGCDGADGYHIERAGQGWRKTDCLEIVGMNMTCDFTTNAEQAAGIRPLIADSAIDDCDAQAVRLLAQSDAGRFIEVKCASGDGYVAQVKDATLSRIIPCSAAQRIGSGCRLTPASARPPSND